MKKQNYSQALLAYEELRGKASFFAKDLHNLSICYLNTNQLDSAISLARQLVLRGRTLDNFSKYKEFDAIASTKEWVAFTKVYPLLRERYEQNLDHSFINIINRAIGPDQEFQKISEEKRDSTYYYQGIMLFDYIFDNGFPDFFKDEEPILASQLLAMLRHFFYLPKMFSADTGLASRKSYSHMVFNRPYSECILKAVYEGKLQPSSYESIMHYSSVDSPFGKIGICFDFDKETVSLDFGSFNSNHEEINKNRRAIGLAQVDSFSVNLEGTWYKEFPFKEIKEAYINCDTCKSLKDYSMLSGEIRERIRDAFKNEELESFIFSYDPSNLRSFTMKGAYKYMPNLK
ncbi:MAG: hypothetical protein RBT74_00910 [Tenuifilaceae bacterium]|nr:hypothetical protein [Tenuifilaceae bacterium]